MLPLSEAKVSADNRGFVSQQYGTSTNLDARSALHALYSTNHYGWFRWVFDQKEIVPGDRTLEIGCGTGALWANNVERLPGGVHVTLTDASSGMLAKAGETVGCLSLQVALAQVDAQALPYADGAFDVVIANHVLYHVPDRSAALNEIARVLAPGGRFYATTIGEGHMRELRTMTGALGPGLERLGGWPLTGFTLEDGPAQVARRLGHVQVRRYVDSLRITAVKPLLDYYRSLRTDDLPAHLDALRDHLERLLADEGVIEVHKDSGMVLARKASEGPAAR